MYVPYLFLVGFVLFWFVSSAMILDGSENYDTIVDHYEKGRIAKSEFVRRVMWHYGVWFWPITLVPFIIFRFFKFFWKLATLAHWALSDEIELPNA